jgi:hypothetical protein
MELTWLKLIDQVSKALGNCKPDALRKVEFAIWKSLISVATGDSDALSAVTNFLQNVEWKSFEKLSAIELNFFAPGEHLQ